MQRGRLITLEGIEGVGKTTQVRYLVEFLKTRGIPVVSTREPGGTPLAEAIRHLILSPNLDEPMQDDTELLLLAAARAQHVQQLIQPHLNTGVWVVCDRFVDATFAYQGGGRGISLARIQTLMQWTLGDFRPDWTLWLDLPVADAMERLNHRPQKKDRLELEPDGFFERVRRVYESLTAQHPDRLIRIDASLPPERVFEQIKTQLINRVKL